MPQKYTWLKHRLLLIATERALCWALYCTLCKELFIELFTSHYVACSFDAPVCSNISVVIYLTLTPCTNWKNCKAVLKYYLVWESKGHQSSRLELVYKELFRNICKIHRKVPANWDLFLPHDRTPLKVLFFELCKNFLSSFSVDHLRKTTSESKIISQKPKNSCVKIIHQSLKPAKIPAKSNLWNIIFKKGLKRCSLAFFFFFLLLLKYNWLYSKNNLFWLKQTERNQILFPRNYKVWKYFSDLVFLIFFLFYFINVIFQNWSIQWWFC